MAINASSNLGKKLQLSAKGAMPTDFPSLGVPWLMSGLVSLYGRSRLANKLPPIADVAISNVPGPQFPLYFAGARLAGFFSVSIPGHGIALNMTVQSYNGSLEVGLTACRRALPDVADLADHVVEEHHKLKALIDASELVVAALQVVAPDVASVKNAARARATAATAAPVQATKTARAAKPTKTASAPRRRAAPATPVPRKRTGKSGAVSARPH